MLEPVLPIAIFLFLGYLFKVVFHDNSKQLIEFIIYFSLPALVFSKIYPLELNEKILYLILMFNGFILINLIVSYLIGKLINLNKLLLATFMIISTFGNTSFIGLSYINTFYGEEYLHYGIIYDLFASFLLLISLGMFIINWGSGKRNDTKSILKNILLFPPTIMFFLTIFAKNYEVPNFLILTSDSIASTLIPIAMISIGMKLEIKHIFNKFHIVSLAILIKMVFIPIIVIFGFQLFLNLDADWIKVTIIEVAMPPMTMAVVLAIKGGLDEKIAINSLVIGVLLSLFTISFYAKFLA